MLMVAAPKRPRLYADETRSPISTMSPKKQRFLDGLDPGDE